MSCTVTELDMSINGALIQKATKTFALSKRYMNIVVGSSILNILYHRVPINASEIKINENFEEVPFVQLRHPKSKDPFVSQFAIWLKAIKHAIGKNYLKVIYVFLKDSDTKEILEFYRFKLKYNTSNDEMDRANHTELRESTLNLLSAINKLGKYEKLKDFTINIELSYHDHTPLTYEPPGFESALMPDAARIKTYSALGHINTGFHSLTCYTGPDNFELKKKSQSKKTPLSRNTSNALSDQCPEEGDLSLVKENTAIDCLCELPVDLGVPLLKCSQCEMNIHAPCYGFLCPFEGIFTCYNCQDLSSSEYKNLVVIAKFRLSLLSLRDSGKVDETILEGHREEVIQIIKNYKIMKNDGSIDKDVLSAIIQEYIMLKNSQHM